MITGLMNSGGDAGSIIVAVSTALGGGVEWASELGWVWVLGWAWALVLE